MGNYIIWGGASRLKQYPLWASQTTSFSQENNKENAFFLNLKFSIFQIFCANDTSKKIEIIFKNNWDEIKKYEK